MTLRSALYAGHVVHDRARPKRHHLRYRVFMLLLDLDEIEVLNARLKRFSRGRFNLLGFHDRDHQDDPTASLKETVLAKLAARGLASEDMRVRAGWVEQDAKKAFYVSPFMPMDLRYAFEIKPPAEAVHVGVDVMDDDGLMLSATFSGERRELTDGAIWKALADHPWQVAGVMAAIHWEAVKIVLKGFRFFPQDRAERGLKRPGEAQRKGRVGDTDAAQVKRWEEITLR
jgi:DUF1365 family protein